MLQRLELLGRFGLDPFTSGIDSGEIWSDCVAQFYEDAVADRDGFLADLHALVATDRGGFATFGAARLVWEFHGGEALRISAAWPFIDAGIEFKRARGLPTMSFTGYEMQRLRERDDGTTTHPSSPTEEA
jgi:hypothetical protein